MNFRLLFLILVFVVVLASLAFIAFGFIRSAQTGKSEDQQLFVDGRIPQPMPDGLYAGSAVYTGGWKGKEFDAANDKGINIFTTRGADRRKYPFSVSTGKGVKDKDLDVIRIDYNIDANPFWLKPILDEVVEIDNGVLLGKLQYRLIPNHPFTIVFFRLERP